MTKEAQGNRFGMEVIIGHMPEKAVHKYMGEVAVQETANQPIGLPEMSADRQATLVERNPDQVYLYGCSDDRDLTEENAKLISEKYGVEADSYLRGYGGATGVARITAVSVAAQYGAEALANYGTDFVAFEAETKQRVENTSNVKLAHHSAESNENNPAELDHDSEHGLGCAYCMLVGAVTDLNKPGSPIDELGRAEETIIFGDDLLLDPVEAANEAVEAQFFGDAKAAFALSRKDLTDLDMPVMILAGKHAAAADVEVVMNFDPTKVSQPGVANRQGSPMYFIDATATAEMIIRAYPELKLQPRIILAAIDHDARAVREALASGEGLHADAMKLVRNGTVEDAVSYLEAIQI